MSLLAIQWPIKKEKLSRNLLNLAMVATNNVVEFTDTFCQAVESDLLKSSKSKFTIIEEAY